KKQVPKLSMPKATNTKFNVINTQATRRTKKAEISGDDLEHALESLLLKEKAKKDHDQNGNDLNLTDRLLLNKKDH
ncbi:10179_t:CDS:2, partial [Funneliformis caledonium]